MHRVAYLARELEQRCGRAAAEMHQRERVRGGNGDRAAPPSLADAGAFDQPARR